MQLTHASMTNKGKESKSRKYTEETQQAQFSHKLQDFVQYEIHHKADR